MSHLSPLKQWMLIIFATDVLVSRYHDQISFASSSNSSNTSTEERVSDESTFYFIIALINRKSSIHVCVCVKEVQCNKTWILIGSIPNGISCLLDLCTTLGNCINRNFTFVSLLFYSFQFWFFFSCFLFCLNDGAAATLCHLQTNSKKDFITANATSYATGQHQPQQTTLQLRWCRVRCQNINDKPTTELASD